MRWLFCKSDLSDEGVIAIEFALGIPLFFFLFFALLDVTRILLAEDLVSRITEKLAYHYKFELDSNERESGALEGLSAEISSLASSTTGSLITPEKLSASVSVFYNLSGYAYGSSVSNAGIFGGEGQIVAYRLEYPVTLNSPLLWLLYSGTSAPVYSEIVIKNGP